ncbi:MAG: hypothetical protein ABW136_00085 [Steroidobacteraceae bacterium]
MNAASWASRRETAAFIALFALSFGVTLAWLKPGAALERAVPSAMAAVPGSWPIGSLTARAAGTPVTIESDAAILVSASAGVVETEPPPPPEEELPVDAEVTQEARIVLASLVGDSLDDVRGEALALSEAFEYEEP